MLDLKARPATVFYLTVSVLLLVVFYVLTQQVLRHAAEVIKLDSLAIKPEYAPVTLGVYELAQKEGVRSGEKQHIRLRYDGQTGWQIANVAKTKRVDAPGGDYKTRYLKRFKLQAGDMFAIKGEIFQVLAAQGQLQIEHSTSQQQLRWQGGQSGRIDTFQAGKHTSPADTVCAEDGNHIKNGLYPYKIAVNDWLVSHHLGKKEETLLFKIGGSVTCLRRWGVLNGQKQPLFAPDSGRIYWLDNHYWLAPGASRQNLIRVKPKSQFEFNSLDQFYQPVRNQQQSIEKLVLGRSIYNVTVTAEQTLILSQAAGDVWLQSDWQKRQDKRPKQMPTSLTSFHAIMTAPQPFAQASEFWVQIFYVVSVGTSLVLAARGRLRSYSGSLWLLSLALLCTGNLVLLQLAVGGINERFLNLSHTFLKVSLVYPLLLFALALMPLDWISRTLHILFRIRQHYETQAYDDVSYGLYLKRRCSDLSFYINGIVNGLIIGYFVMMTLQAVGGLESGVAGYQPVELSKFIVILISTISAAGYYEKRYLDAYDNQGSILWSVQQTFALFIWLGLMVIFTAVMLGLVRDFSPIALIFMYLWLFCLRILPHPLDGSLNKVSKLIAAGLVILLCIPAYVLVSTKMNGIPPAVLMNADRFQVWANPALYPHSGSQVIDSMTLISNGNALGQETWFGRNSSEIMQLPAVQDDFIATFLLTHFGYVPGLALLAVQLLFVWQLSRLSSALLHDPQLQGGGALERQLGYSGSLFCFGFAGLLIAHWLISWCNVLGLLPVMGQPMALLSSGGSNLLLFVMPCLLLSFCFAWIKEQ